MKKILIALPLIAMTAACQQYGTNRNQGALTGAAIGSAAGAALTDDNRVAGALVGGAVGAAAGNYVGQTSNGACVYRYPSGQTYTAACP